MAIVGGMDIVVEATKKVKSASRVDVCVETMKNILKEIGLGSIENFSNQLCLPRIWKKGWNL